MQKLARNINLDLVNVNAYMQNLVLFHQFVLKLLSGYEVPLKTVYPQPPPYFVY